MDLTNFAVAPERLRKTADPGSFPFTCTDEITAPSGFIGQDRATSALEFGLGVGLPGYNIFVAGLSGTGKSTVVQAHLRELTTKMEREGRTPQLHDWCYVFNFSRPDQPEAIQLAPGGGRQLVEEMDNILSSLRKDIPAAFNDENYKNEIRKISEETVAARAERIREAEESARKRGFTIQAGPAGIAVIPLVQGKPIDQETYESLNTDQRRQIERGQQEIAREVAEILEQIRQQEHETHQRIAELDRTVARNSVEPLFAPLREKYKGTEDVSDFLDGLFQYTLDQISALRGVASDDDDGELPQSTDGSNAPRDPLVPFRVNLFVDNSETDGPPIITEDNPTYPNLFGHIERRPTMGTYITDHTMLKPGALVLASGGYLVVEARAVLSHAGVWDALKRVLKVREVRPEDPADIFMPGIMPQTVRAEAIPINVKVMLTGEPEIYQLLAAYDPDFWEIFKVLADLGSEMPRTDDHMREYSEFVCGTCNTRDLRHFTDDGVAAIIEQGSRFVGDQEKLTTRFGPMVDLVVESAYWAEQAGEDRVSRQHVEQALEQKIYRSNRVSEILEEMIVDGTIMVDLEGEEVGQVNGLAVYSAGDIAFGKPSRITARSYVGRQGVINIEREVRLSGQTHDKGVMILTGYLGAKFAQDFPLSVNLSLTFEQSYGMIDGDSASSTELYAVLSQLSGIPIRQDIAVTGSVNQMGEIQPIGGVNEKVEGFFDVCQASGMLDGAGVLVPHQNVRNLMLRPDVVEAVKAGQFHVYSVKTIDEGISVLTGVEAGQRGADGSYPADSVNGRVEVRLRDYADTMQKFIGRG